MFKSLQIAFLSVSVALNGVAPAYAMNADEGSFFFRYKNTISHIPDAEAKDISATFVGGVDHPFSQALPLKAQWSDDTWNIVSGTLPAGISFDPSTKRFSGKPTAATRKMKVNLRGLDELGREVATAEVFFDIYAMEGQSFFEEVYAHTGKYKFDQLPLPQNTVIADWNVISGPPTGVEIIGRNLDGTPVREGAYSMFIQGSDYRGEVVASYAINYLVEDGPSFPDIAIQDRVYPLPRYTALTFSAFGPPRINHAIEDFSKVKYGLEVAEGEVLPGTLSSNHDPKALAVSGSVYGPYETAKIRWTARDSDGTTGESKWFTVGSSDPTPYCGQPGAPYRLVWPTGTPVNTWAGIPSGAMGTLEYEVTSGELPDPVVLDRNTGYFSGTPKTASAPQPVTVTISMTTAGNTVKTDCYMMIGSSFGIAKIASTTAAQDTQIRLGDQFNGRAQIVGGIPTFDWSFADPASFPSFSFTKATVDAAEVTLSGVPTSAGSHAIPLTVANGDQNTVSGAVGVLVHDELGYRTQPTTFVVKKYQAPQAWGSIDYDPATVIRDMSGGTTQPGISFSASAGQSLPAGIDFGTPTNPYGLYGMATSNAGVYGPFSVTISDFSGDTKVSDDFYVEVTERADMTVESMIPVGFHVDLDKQVDIKPMTVAQPKGAENLSITYALNGPALPAGLSFGQPDEGVISAAAGVPYESRGVHGPYTIKATDSEGYSTTSPEFYITVNDRPDPGYVAYSQVSGNVTGVVPAGEAQTWVDTGSLRARILPDSVFGGQSAVVFTSVSPTNPAGLDFDYQTGAVYGVPVSEFSGDVTVEFKDLKDRTGAATIPLVVKSYPRIRMNSSTYELPRLADAPAYIDLPQKVAGFWGLSNPTWSLAEDEGSQLLPLGLKVNPASGQIEGRTEVLEGTTYGGLILKAVETDPYGRKLPTFSPPFSIEVGARQDASFSYSFAGADKLTWKLNDITPTASYTLASMPTVNYSPSVLGSYVGKLKYSIPALPAGLSGIGVDGNGRLTGFPSTLGSWTVEVQVEDEDLPPMVEKAFIDIKATLDGFVEPTNTSSQVSPPIKLRKNQEFQIPADPRGITVKNVVGTPVFSTWPTILPNGIDFSGVTGSFSASSHFEELPAANGQFFDIQLNALDDDKRTFPNNLVYRFTVLERLSMSMAQTAFASKQYVGDVAIQFPDAGNQIGEVTYALSGDLPGTRVDMVYDAQTKSFLHYTYTDENDATVTTTDPESLPYDALVFDPMNRTLVGTPSRSGVFPLTITATDSNIFAPLYAASTRTLYEKASVGFEIDVEAADELMVEADTSSYLATRYSPQDRMSVTWNEAENVIGTVSYSVDGDLPGTLAVKTYDPDGVFIGYTVNGVLVGSVSSLPDDALVFDGVTRTLTGIPSKVGTFTFRIVATDSFKWAGGTDSTPDITVTVAEALPLQVSNTVGADQTSSETVPRFTNQPTMRSTVMNAAYGKKVTWTPVAGVLPQNVSEVAGNSALSYRGYPEAFGTSAGIVWKATDAVGRTINTDPVSFTVVERLQLKLVASSNPAGLVVNTTDANVIVRASNRAYGLPIGTSKWSVTGTLPPGITADITDDAVTFKGKATVIGVYDNIVVSAEDSLGGALGRASIPISFLVIVPEDKITLETTDIVTKPGFTFSMTPTYGNTYGQVAFSSPEVAVTYKASLSLDSGNGIVAGSFSTSGDRNINLRITDETKRLTSNYVTIKVIPSLTPIVATQVKVTQGKPLVEDIDAFNVIGTLSFKKGGGNWPDGVVVNPDDGSLSFAHTDPVTGIVSNKVTLATGTYDGLTIVGTDTAADGQVDTRSSNVFSIVVSPVDDEPDIHDVTATPKQLYTVNTPMSFKPTVKEKLAGGDWNYSGTKYALNKNLEADTGLDFDENTGVISGTATKPVIYTDLTIRVTSTMGDTDVTKPFWFGVQPDGPIVPTQGQKTGYFAREGKAFTSGVPSFDNTFGTLTHTKKSGIAAFLVAANGTVTATPAIGSSSTTAKPISVEVTDEFGRKGDLTIDVTILKELSVQAIADGAAMGVDLASSVPVITGLQGNASFTFSNLSGAKASFTGAATGVVSGKFTSGDPGDTHTVVLTVTDSADGATSSTNLLFAISAQGAARYWKFVCTNWDTSFNASEMRLYNEKNENVTQLATVTSAGNYPGFPITYLTDGVTGVAYPNAFYSPADMNPNSLWVKFEFKTQPQAITKLWFMKRMSYAWHNCTGWDILSSKDDVTYSLSWKDGFTGWNFAEGKEYMSVKP